QQGRVGGYYGGEWERQNRAVGPNCPRAGKPLHEGVRLGDLALKIGAVLEGDPDIDVTGMAPLETATETEVTFLSNPRYKHLVRGTRAAAVILAPDEQAHGKAALRAKEPYAAVTKALAFFDDRARPVPGVHATAVIAESASVGEGAYVGAYAVIGERT